MNDFASSNVCRLFICQTEHKRLTGWWNLANMYLEALEIMTDCLLKLKWADTLKLQRRRQQGLTGACLSFV